MKSLIRPVDKDLEIKGKNYLLKICFFHCLLGWCPSTCLYACLSLSMLIHPFIHRFVPHLWMFILPMSTHFTLLLSVCPLPHISLCLSVCSLCFYVCLSVYLFLSLFILLSLKQATYKIVKRIRKSFSEKFCSCHCLLFFKSNKIF